MGGGGGASLVCFRGSEEVNAAGGGQGACVWELVTGVRGLGPMESLWP